MEQEIAYNFSGAIETFMGDHQPNAFKNIVLAFLNTELERQISYMLIFGGADDGEVWEPQYAYRTGLVEYLQELVNDIESGAYNNDKDSMELG